MEIVVDSNRNITQLFNLISTKIKTSDMCAELLLDNYIVIDFKDSKVKNIIVKALSEHILNEYEQELAYSFIKPFEMPKKDSEKVLGLLLSDLSLKNKRLDILNKEIKKIICNRHINVDGLTKFRLENYKNELKFSIELMISELENQKSYEEFISMMKYYTEIQKSSAETIVLSENNGQYFITDVSGEPLNLTFDEEFSDEFLPFDITDEDLLISNLMAVMPEKIIFKDINRDKPVINTIQRIFEGRILN